ncbi:MAG TPA: hypothetical protein PKE12_10180 [Kiritimatiellia bacterium]|nr:hypothetical protein [Kiritimatiellia bacterium]
MWRNRGKRIGCAVCALALGIATARGEEPAETPITPSRPKPDRSILDTLDRYHAAACSYVIGFGHGMDGWLSTRFRDPETRRRTQATTLLSTPEQLENVDGSRIILSPILEHRDGDGFQFGLKAKGRLHLPQLSERIELLFDSDFDDSDVTPAVSRANDTGLRSGDAGAATLRLRLSDDVKFKPSVEAGLKFKPEPVPRLGLRGRLTHRGDYLTTRFTQTFFWETEDGFGERSSLDFEQSRRNEFLRRLSTSVLWSEGSDGVRGGQTLQLYRFLSNRRAIGLKLGVEGPLEPSAHVETYSARVSYRQRVHRDWLFIEFEPGFDWPRDEDYDAIAVFRVKFDIVIGDWFENGNGK